MAALENIAFYRAQILAGRSFGTIAKDLSARQRLDLRLLWQEMIDHGLADLDSLPRSDNTGLCADTLAKQELQVLMAATALTRALITSFNQNTLERRLGMPERPPWIANAVGRVVAKGWLTYTPQALGAVKLMLTAKGFAEAKRQRFPLPMGISPIHGTLTESAA